MARTIHTIAIAGSGTMGSSMAETFAKFGYEVILYDIVEAALNKARDLIALHEQTACQDGLSTPEQSQALMSRIRYTTDVETFGQADFVVEAIVEKLEIKHSFWQQVSRLVEDDVVLTSNTSGLSITEIAQVIHLPERFGGMHWINPPHIIPLIEVIRGEQTSQETANIIYDLCLQVEKKPVHVKDAPGFCLNRIQLAILRECLHIAEAGIASPEDIDKVMKYALGVRYACLGPMEVCDHGGLDIFYNIASYLFADLSDAKEPFGLLKEAVENGHYGVKNGRGFYDYSDGKDAEAIQYRDRMYNKVSQCLFGQED
ncbi:MAG: 3-hydroxyacyl-CoA dehydrogenase family protein [Ruminococcaceae bacterium]|nr:3-hydroxyacyl-CoA dehydrogenase family protein [Oscillospiraceae bacterium]